MKKAWLAGLLNFFTLGLGTLYNMRRSWVGIFMTVGAVLSVYVELSLKEANPDLYWYSFFGFFALGIATAIDGYREANQINSSQGGQY